MTDKLQGEGEAVLVLRTRVRRECEGCGELAVYLNTYLNDGEFGARNNPASSAYGKDDCSWCSDHDQYLCSECHVQKHKIGVPNRFSWCSTFNCCDRFAHSFLEWREEEIKAGLQAKDKPNG